MLTEHIDKWGGDKDTWYQLPILMYELGNLAKAVVYRKRYPEDAIAWRGELKAALADLIAQCIVLCEREGLCFEEMKNLGIERCIEKITRHIEKGE